MTLISRVDRSLQGIGARKIILPEELKLCASPNIWAWVSAGHGNQTTRNQRMVCRKTGMAYNQLSTALAPLLGTDGPSAGGGNTGRYLQAGATDPAAVLLSAGGVVPADKPFCVWFLAVSGSAAGSSALSVAGSNGKALGFRLRSGNLMQLYDGATLIVQGAASSGNWHLIEVLYDRATFFLRVDNVAVANAAYDWAQAATAVALLGTLDLVTGVSAYGRGLRLAEVIVGEPVGTQTRLDVNAYIVAKYGLALP